MSVWREVQEALYQRWTAGWVDSDDPPAAKTPYCFENDPFDPPDAPWCRFSVKRLPGGPGTLGRQGNRRMDRAGNVFVQIMEPPGAGVGRSSDLAEQAAKIFEGCRFEPHDIRFAEVEPGEGALVDGERWWGIVLAGRFEYEDII